MTNLEAVLKYLKDNKGITFSDGELESGLTLYLSNEAKANRVVAIMLERDKDAEYDRIVFSLIESCSYGLVLKGCFGVNDEANSNLMDMLNIFIPSGLVTLAKASDSTPLACSSEGKPANKKLSEILTILEDSGFKIVATCDFMNKYRIVVDYDKQP